MNMGNGQLGGCGPFYGKYRGVVTDNRDPDRLGRIRARVPDILGDEALGWALPATPYAGDGVGLYLIPPVDAFVWIEFEQGDLEYPIWAGCFWGKRDKLPAQPTGPDIKVLKTESATIEIQDQAKQVRIELNAGAKKVKITMSGNEILIDDGSLGTIKLAGNTVSINGNALEVT